MSYLMWKTKSTFNTIMNEVKSKRPVCSPNAGFIVQLLKWEKMLTKPDLAYLFRISPLNDMYYEHKQLVSKICNSNELNSRTCFILCSFQLSKLFIWIGSKSTEETLKSAENFSGLYNKYFTNDKYTIEYIKEGNEESPQFKKTLSQVKIDKNTGENFNGYKDIPYFDFKPETILKKVTNNEEIDEDEDEDEDILNGELYEFNNDNWNVIKQFDTEDLFEEGFYVLKPENEKFFYIWVGVEAIPLENKKNIQDTTIYLASHFKNKFSLQDYNFEVVYQDEESEEFLKYFSNG
jgi:hypothetical protein